MNWEGGEGVHETRSSPKDCKAFDTTRNIGLLAPPLQQFIIIPFVRFQTQ